MRIGAFRRIDNLGRIVIPKSIRKVLKIKPGDNLQIIEENKIIKLKKYSEIENIEQIGKTIYEILKETLKTEVYITDREKIIIPNIKNNTLTNQIINEINKRKIQTINQIEITDNIKNDITINPIISNGDLQGSIIICDNIEDKKLIEIMTKILSKSLEE